MRTLLLITSLLALPSAATDGGVPRAARTVETVRLLYFSASWCASCRRLDEAKVPASITARLPALRLERVDVDANEALREKYGVEVTPTLVLVDADGFPLGRPRIDLDDPAGTVDRAVKLVEKMTRRRLTSSP
ncbi:MAG: thioredoxin family protein [Myxococcaceae bacterium]|nr:thioredoxin family protein [Myxococcaceae bacterium]